MYYTFVSELKGKKQGCPYGTANYKELPALEQQDLKALGAFIYNDKLERFCKTNYKQ
jgi:hypothetical protein